jgi:hypothetical protein
MAAPGKPSPKPLSLCTIKFLTDLDISSLFNVKGKIGMFRLSDQAATMGHYTLRFW